MLDAAAIFRCYPRARARSRVCVCVLSGSGQWSNEPNNSINRIKLNLVSVSLRALRACTWMSMFRCNSVECARVRAYGTGAARRPIEWRIFQARYLSNENECRYTTNVGRPTSKAAAAVAAAHFGTYLNAINPLAIWLVCGVPWICFFFRSISCRGRIRLAACSLSILNQF